MELDTDEEDDCEKYPSWACQIIACTDTWSHARRKRRMEMREESLKKQRLEDLNESEKIKLNTNCFELATDKTNTDPLLTCTLLAREKGKKNNDSKEFESDEECSSDEKMLRICLVFESGHGGKQSLETLRQYFVNKLNIREFFHKKNPSKPNKRKRKRKK